MQGQELQETGFYQYKWRHYIPDVGRFFTVDPLASKYSYNSTYAFQENKLGLGVELEGLELLENKTGFFAIRGNEMMVKRAPLTQTYVGTDGNRYASFKPGDIGLTTSGYNPSAPRITTGTTGLKLESYKYTGPTPDAAQMQDSPDAISNKDRQSFTTTKRGSEMWNLKQRSIDRSITGHDGVVELFKQINLLINIPDAIKSTSDYVQASKDVNAINRQAIQMDQAIQYVDSSGIEMNQQMRNDVVNFVIDGTLPPGTDTQNGLIIQNGTSILRSNGLPVRETEEQKKANSKILP